MTTRSAFLLRTYYSGTVAAKLQAALDLHECHAAHLNASPVIREELDRLRHGSHALSAHMQSMNLGRLCSQCAERPGGGCCSAYMADNTDSILLLINLLLGIPIQPRHNSAADCCFLGEQGCIFLIKPIFCLNYNCKAILDTTEDDRLQTLYRLAGAVLSRQTRLETLLLDALQNSCAGEADHPTAGSDFFP